MPFKWYKSCELILHTDADPFEEGSQFGSFLGVADFHSSQRTKTSLTKSSQAQQQLSLYVCLSMLQLLQSTAVMHV